VERLQKFQNISSKDMSRLYDVLGILKEIEGIKSNPEYQMTFHI